MSTRRPNILFNVSTDRANFRERLVARMKACSLSGAALAREARLSRDAISTYTTMRSLPTPKTLDRLAKVLKCKPTDLIPVTPVTETVLELHDHYGDPGLKVLVCKMALPYLVALERFHELALCEQTIRESRIKNAGGS